MKLSIVTISFNQAEFLQRCIDSVAAQKGVDYEHIIIDACSTDGSQKIIENNPAYFSKIIIEKDRGPADGLNKGFAHATGDIFAYLNADDEYLPGSFSKMIEAFARRPEADVIFGDGKVIDGDGAPLGFSLSASKFSRYRYLLGATMVCQPATFFRKEIYRATDGFNLQNSTCWDGELLLDMSERGATFVHTPQFLANFRLHDASITGSGRMQEAFYSYKNSLFEQRLHRKKRLSDKVLMWVFRIENRLKKALRKKA